MLRALRKLLYDPALQKKKEFLRGLELFKDLHERELATLAQTLHARTYHEGETIFLEGDIGRALFVLESGRVDLTKNGGADGSMKLHTIKPGDFFGEMALLENIPRTASATAAERSRLFLLYRSKLEGILHHQPRIGIKIMTHLARILSARLRRASAVVPEARRG